MSAPENLSEQQWPTETKVDRIGPSEHLVTVTTKRYAQMQGRVVQSGRTYTVRKGEEGNPSARGGAYVSGWRVTGTGTKALHPTRKAAVAAATDHFTNVYMGGR